MLHKHHFESSGFPTCLLCLSCYLLALNIFLSEDIWQLNVLWILTRETVLLKIIYKCFWDCILSFERNKKAFCMQCKRSTNKVRRGLSARRHIRTPAVAPVLRVMRMTSQRISGRKLGAERAVRIYLSNLTLMKYGVEIKVCFVVTKESSLQLTKRLTWMQNYIKKVVAVPVLWVLARWMRAQPGALSH